MTQLLSLSDGIACQALALTHTFLPNLGYWLLDGHIRLLLYISGTDKDPGP